MLIVLSPVMVGLSISIVTNSKDGVLFRQERITQYGRRFRIFRFRTMVVNVEQLGNQVKVFNDIRVTKAGVVIRKLGLNELPQITNIILGDMS